MLAGFPLGIFEEATYEERSFILDTGDIDRLPFRWHRRHAKSRRRILRPHAPGPDLSPRITELKRRRNRRQILEEVDAFSGGAHPFDDRTLVVLKVK